jgi:hypothetical protein
LTKKQRKKIKKLYYDPTQRLTHGAKLHKKVSGITLAQINDFIQEQKTGQLYRQSHRRQYYPITAPPHSYQADLIFMKDKNINNGYDTALTLIEITSRRGYCYPMKGKPTAQVMLAIKQFLKDVDRTIMNLTTDMGSEFRSGKFKALMTRYNVKHVLADEGDHSKMGMIERFNRTVKALMSKYMTAYKTKKWIDALPDLMYNYNHTIHSGIGFSPANVGAREGALIRIAARDKTRKLDSRKNLNVGDKVRVRKQRGLFSKEGRRWSNEVFTITEDHVKTFKVDDDEDRRHKHYELIKVKVPPSEDPFKREIRSPDVERALAKARKRQRQREAEAQDAPSPPSSPQSRPRPVRKRIKKKRFAIDLPGE